MFAIVYYGILIIVKRRGLPRNRINLSKDELVNLYTTKKLSVSMISKIYECSENKINYWLKQYKIAKRTISDAIYQIKNPSGDPFVYKEPKSLRDGILFGMGLGLYWGEGAKRGTGGVRLTNTDPRLLRKFIEFLENVFCIDRDMLRFGLQIFRDIPKKKALDYWRTELGMRENQFYKVIVSKVRGSGTYKYKSEYGVIIIYFNNIKLKKLICSMIENIR